MYLYFPLVSRDLLNLRQDNGHNCLIWHGDENAGLQADILISSSVCVFVSVLRDVNKKRVSQSFSDLESKSLINRISVAIKIYLASYTK